MVDQNPVTADTTGILRSALKSQFHAALAMLKQAIEQCPDDLWVSRDPTNPFWRITYHTLYFVHLYIQPQAESFRPWEHHQTGIQDLDDRPAPPDILELTELPHRPPQTGEPYTRAQMLEYWAICDAMIDETLDAQDIWSSESGFSWYRISKLEHKIVAVRHIQHHTAQLADRLRAARDTHLDWVGARPT